MMSSSSALNFLPADISDFITDSTFGKKEKKLSKRQRPDKAEECNPKPTISNNFDAKKRKTDEDVEESRQKLVNVMTQHIESRNKANEILLKKLSEVVSRLETDYKTLKENEQKFEIMIESFMKCIQKTTNKHKQILKTLKEIQTAFKKEYEEMEANQREQTEALGKEIEDDIKKLQAKIVSETKKSGWEIFNKLINIAKDNDV